MALILPIELQPVRGFFIWHLLRGMRADVALLKAYDVPKFGGLTKRQFRQALKCAQADVDATNLMRLHIPPREVK